MRRLFLLLLAPLALLAASCGGGGGGSSLAQADAAVVSGTHITRSELDRLVQQYKCSYELQKKTFPTASLAAAEPTLRTSTWMSHGPVSASVGVQVQLLTVP